MEMEVRENIKNLYVDIYKQPSLLKGIIENIKQNNSEWTLVLQRETQDIDGTEDLQYPIYKGIIGHVFGIIIKGEDISIISQYIKFYGDDSEIIITEYKEPGKIIKDKELLKNLFEDTIKDYCIQSILQAKENVLNEKEVTNE